MIFKNQKLQKVCATLILISMVSFGFAIKPQKAEAGIPVIDAIGNAIKTLILTKETTQTVLTVKAALKEVLKQVAMAVAKRLLAEMTKSTVNWINSGFHGKPLFLENPESFFENITKREIRTLVDIFGYDSARYPYGRGWSLGIIGAYKRTLDQSAAYSLSQVEWSATQAERDLFLQNYRSNFNIGGWNGLLLHTQYPQNNAIGFMMLATDEIARRTDKSPDSDSPIGKLKQDLEKGLGFFSQEACSTNPGLETDPNNPPTFNASKEVPYEEPPRSNYNSDDEYRVALGDYNREYQNRVATTRASWEGQNLCQGPWVKNTPGFVAANSIVRALGAGQNLTELQAALGGSLSAIFDALLSKLFSEGVSALASRNNPPPPQEDNWDYLGNRLGSGPTDSGDPFSWPDQEVNLDKFRKQVLGKTIITAADGSITERVGNTEQGTYKSPGEPLDPGDSMIQGGEYIPGDIYNTERELALLDNPNSPGNPGLMQYLSAIWPKARQLDICLPGPNYKWEERVDDQVSRFVEEIQAEIGGTDKDEQREGGIIIKEVNFAASFFKDWVRNEMLTSLPSAYTFLNAINTLEDYQQMIPELRSQISRKHEALAMLTAVRTQLVKTFTGQPTPGDSEEKRLVQIWKQYEAIRPYISNSFTVEDSRAQQDSLKLTLGRLNEYTVSCVAERQEKKWNIPPPDSKGDRWSNSYGTASFNTDERDKLMMNAPTETLRVITSTRKGTERELFCSLPAYNGYSHGESPEGKILFQNPFDRRDFGGNVLYPEIPRLGGRIPDTDSMGSKTVSIDCNDIFRSYSTDYKGDIPGALIIEATPTPDDINPGNDPPPPPPPPPPGGACDPAIDPNCVPPGGCGGQGQIACS